MGVKDHLVRQWIAAALSPSAVALPNDSQIFIEELRSVDEVNNAWGRLKLCRDAGNSLNLDLAAAEHYLFARFVGSSEGDTSFRAAPKFYETAKSLATIDALKEYLKTSDQPISPVDPDVTRWGEAGVEKGLSEYEKRTGQAPSNKAGIAGAAILFAYGLYYSRYKPPQGSSCDVMITPEGKWESTDATGRWRLEFSDGAVKWTETGTAGSLSRTVPVHNALGFTAGLRIERPNDDEVLTFLGFGPSIRSQISASSPKPSYMVLFWKDGILSARWSGLLVTKDSKNQLKEIKQPGDTPWKPYEFRRADI